MIKSVNNYPVSQLFDVDANVVYAVPRYQREYTWSKSNWERLFDDLLENEPGYFLGSIICINKAEDALAVQQLEVVDGQQRLTTLSLLIAAVYRYLKGREKELDDEQRLELLNVKRKLVLRRDPEQVRVIPQIQGSNQGDYRAVLAEIGILGDGYPPLWAGNRRIFKAFRYFSDRLQTLHNGHDDSLIPITELLDKINQASMVKIEVADHADAYVLFESLNDRGVPLTAVDLIKNKLLAKFETIEPGRVEHFYGQWTRLLDYLSDDYNVQERFFRHYYNAFKDELNAPFRHADDKRKDPLGSVATRSNLMQIYQRLINRDPNQWLQQILQAGKTYSVLLPGKHGDGWRGLERSFRNLANIQGTPAYLLVLYILERQEMLGLSHQQIAEINCVLVRFFVRRNLTDTPPTRDLTRLFMQIIERFDGITEDTVVETIRQQLLSVSADDATFRAKLEGQIYDENAGVARYILCTLAEQGMTRENKVDLWEWRNRHYTWTIEHIFPQGEDIPKAWVEMIADGDAQLAKEYQQRYVHMLGNLTMSAYNAPLGTRPFEEKRDLKDRGGRFIGYRNGLVINEDVADMGQWGVEQIVARTHRLVNQALAMFQIDGNGSCE